MPAVRLSTCIRPRHAIAFGHRDRGVSWPTSVSLRLAGRVLRADGGTGTGADRGRDPLARPLANLIAQNATDNTAADNADTHC